MTIETILIPSDGSDRADAAAGRGFDLAAQLEADVHVLSVADSGLATSATYVGDSPRIRKRLREDAETYVSRLETEARDLALTVNTAVREGIPAQEIVEYADEQGIDCIVMGTAGRGSTTRAIVGSVADKVIRTASVPVVTVNPRSFEESASRIDSILVPTDGSPPAVTAAERTIDIAAQLDATVHIFSVVEEHVTGSIGSILEAEGIDTATALEERAADHVGRLATTARDRDLEFVSVTTVGDPATEIVEYADEHDIGAIGMGTHGHGGFKRFLIGSVTVRVVRRAAVGVMTIREYPSSTAESGEGMGAN